MMRKTVWSMALLVLIGSPAALAQGGSSTVAKNPDRPATQAPVGHRQPRASDVPNEKSLSIRSDPINREDIALDRKIKSICRGC
ncbi:hypothetical protein [Bradyrhizobium sp.]|uniref:hypothetical protein n=1 Tax=Bradyrhizobium sp. TaxID=376 RepID=UPI003C7638FF